MSGLKSALLATAGAMLIAGAAQAQEFTMRIATAVAPSNAICSRMLHDWAEAIKEQSGGRIDYTLDCGGVIAPMGDAINRVAQGVVDVAWDIPLVYGARYASLGVTAIPGTFDDPEPAAGALWQLYADGIIPHEDKVRVAFYQVFNNMVVWSVDPIENLGTLGGLKVAAGSRERAGLISALGGEALGLRPSEYYQALARGAIGGIMTNPAPVYELSLNEYLDNAVIGPLGGGVSVIVMNPGFYDRLPDDLKAVVDANTGRATSEWASTIIRDIDVALIDEHVADGSLTVHRLSAEELAALQPAFDKVTESWVGATEKGAVYLEAFRQALASRD